MTREEKILSRVDKSKPGVEIGPSYGPIASKKAGYQVHIIDHLDQEGLRAKYRSHNVDINNIEEVDFVWDGKSYLKLTENENYYQWIIASHVIEHTPDIVSFLIECEEILASDGVLSLAVPDSRFCFDHMRSLSSISEVIDAYLQKRRIHSAGNVFDHFANFTSKNDQIVWLENQQGENKVVHDLTHAKTVMDLVVNKQEYVDTHAWVFTPSSFRLIISDLNFLGMTNLKEEIFYPNVGHEFYITLSRDGLGIREPRVKILEAIKEELNAR